MSGNGGSECERGSEYQDARTIRGRHNILYVYGVLPVQKRRRIQPIPRCKFVPTKKRSPISNRSQRPVLRRQFLFWNLYSTTMPRRYCKHPENEFVLENRLG